MTETIHLLPAKAAPMRRLAGALLLTAAAVVGAGSAAQAQDKLTVCTIVPTTEIEYFATLLNEYTKSGEKRGIEVTTIDSQNNPAREASSIEDCVAKKVNAIVASVIDPATSKASASWRSKPRPAAYPSWRRASRASRTRSPMVTTELCCRPVTRARG